MKRATLWIAGLLVVVAGLLVTQTMESDPGLHVAQSDTPLVHGTSRSPSRKTTISSFTTTMDPAQALHHAQEQLLNNPSSAPDVFRALRNALFQAGSESSARAVSEFLRSGLDAPTGMGFSVGPDGVLASPPTLRAALLNWHPTLDPRISLEMAREILKTTDSADEYAVALRNLAWNDADGNLKPELSAAFRNLLARHDWQETPTAGYLESFDVAVALGDTATFQQLAQFADPKAYDESIVRAACMSMDRMILRDPSHLTSAWNSNPQWMDQAPMQRASLLSRLDLTRQDHRTILVDYLSSNRMTPEERQYFEALYPNGNHLHGHRLVTTNEPTPSIEERTAMDREILRHIDDLLHQSSATTANSLRIIRERMATSLEQ